MAGRTPPSPDALKRFDVNRPGAVEAIFQPLYDFQAYAAAGQTQLTFFQDPQGSNSKTLADTNMESAGQLPAPKEMLVTGIELVFWSGVTPGIHGAQVAADYWNDVHAVMKSGWLNFFIGSKSYLTDAPVGKFPASFRLGGVADSSDSTTAAADSQTLTQYATFSSRPYEITPVRLPSNQNFNVTLNWPSAVALPSAVAGRIGVMLQGFQYRLSQ